MSSYAEVVVLAEGATEQRFVKQVLAPYNGRPWRVFDVHHPG